MLNTTETSLTSLSPHSEILLPLEHILTKEEEKYIEENYILVKYVDDKGRQYIKENGKFKRISVLNAQKKSKDGLFNFKVNRETYLDAFLQIPKTDPRIRFRGELDDCIAQVLVLYHTLENEKARQWLLALRSILGNVMSSTATHKTLEPFVIDSLSADTLHQYSHYPLKYLDYDHIVPDVLHGKEVLLLNTLRTKIRLLESTGFTAYSHEENILRPDILYTLNRLSSAVYVLMILLVRDAQAEK